MFTRRVLTNFVGLYESPNRTFRVRESSAAGYQDGDKVKMRTIENGGLDAGLYSHQCMEGVAADINAIA